jgi:hypothetical protein
LAREWCVVVDLESASAARKLGRVLGKEGFDVSVDMLGASRVWCFAESEHECRVFLTHVVELAEGAGLDRRFEGVPAVLTWSEDERRYVDPDPAGDSDGEGV